MRFVEQYGYISLDPSENIKTVIDPLKSNAPTERDASGDQCLRFYYYFTVYDGKDWGQQIQMWIRPNNDGDNRVSIGSLTANDMKENKWYFKEITMQRNSPADTVRPSTKRSDRQAGMLARVLVTNGLHGVTAESLRRCCDESNDQLCDGQS